MMQRQRVAPAAIELPENVLKRTGERSTMHGGDLSPKDLDGLGVLLSDLSIELRPYQLRIAQQTGHAFQGQEHDRPARSVLIVSPAGAGKTIMALMVAMWIQRKLGRSLGWVAMPRNLLRQALEENDRRGFNLDLGVISMFDKDPPRVAFLIVDEAQHDAARSMADLHGGVMEHTFHYGIARLNDFQVLGQRTVGRGKYVAREIAIDGVRMVPSRRFWSSIHRRFGVSDNISRCWLTLKLPTAQNH